MKSVELIPVADMPHIQPGDNIAQIVVERLAAQDITLQNGDILALAQKVVSKSEGQLVNLRNIEVSDRAKAIAPLAGKDPRHVQVILNESKEVIWVSPGIFVVETRHGFVCANAGVDRSNIEQPGTPEEGDEWLALLPENPNYSAQIIKEKLLELSGAEVAVLINDTHGRPFRMGGVGVAIGSAGLQTLVDERGESDMFGYKLQSTMVGIGDELASAASLIMGQADEATPAVLIRGYRYRPVKQPDTGAAVLVRPGDKDVFRYPQNRKLY